MKVAHKIIGLLWMAICIYFFATYVQAIYEMPPNRPNTLAIILFFIFLYVGGATAGFFVIVGARWARIVLSVVAVLIVMASLLGWFAYFNAMPYSAVGIAFDLFALISAVILVFVRKHAAAGLKTL